MFLMETRTPNPTRIVTQVGNDRSHRVSFKKRKECIKKKSMELATLCDITVCTIILGPDGEVDTWPENQSTVRAIIRKFNNLVKKNNGEMLELVENLNEKIKEVDKRIDAVTKRNRESIFSDLDNALIEGVSRESFGSKSEALRERMKLLKSAKEQNNAKGKELVLYERETSQTMQAPYRFDLNEVPNSEISDGMPQPLQIIVPTSVECSFTLPPPQHSQQVPAMPISPTGSYGSYTGSSSGSGGGGGTNGSTLMIGESSDKTYSHFTSNSNDQQC